MFGECPYCKEPLMPLIHGYECINYAKNGCDFKLPPSKVMNININYDNFAKSLSELYSYIVKIRAILGTN